MPDHADDRLEPLVDQAIEAWGEEFPPLPPSDSFVDRVMAAERSGHMRFETVVEPLHDASPPARSRWLATGLGLAASLVAAGVVAAVVSLEPGAPIEGPAGATDGALEVAGETAMSTLGGTDLPNLRVDGDPGTPIPADLHDQVKTYLDDYGRHWGPAFEFHGVVLVARQGRVAYARGFGVARPESGTPNGPGTRFRLGMLTEQFTAAAILKLRDEGALELSDPLSKFLPEFPRGRSITIEHLLGHTSGLPNYTAMPEFRRWKAEHHTTEELVERIAALPAAFEPGTDFLPSNSGYALLGAVIEAVSGNSYGDYIETRLSRPLGLEATSMGDVFETGEQARGNVWNDEEILEPPDPVDLSSFGAAGGLVSSALDLARWDRALHEGHVISPDSVEQMLTPNGEGYGFGYYVTEGYGQRVASFPGVIDGYNDAMLRFLDDHTLVVVLSNNEVIPAMRVAQDVAAMVYGDEPERRLEHHEVEIAPGTFPRFTGTYTLSSPTEGLESMHVRRFGDRLYLDVPGHGLTWMHPMGHNRFFFKDHAGTTVSFELGTVDGEKRATTMTVWSGGATMELERSPD